MSIPQHCPTPRELDDLELLLGGAFAPVVGFNEAASPITLHLPASVEQSAAAAGGVELVDPEGLPLARVTWPTGEVEAIGTAAYGPFRRLHLSPAETREEYAGRAVVPVVDALTERQLDELRGLGPVVLLALTGVGTAALSPVGLVRATLLAARLLDDAAVVAVPLASHGDPALDHELGVAVVATYAGDAPVHGLADDEDGELSDEVAAVVAQNQPERSKQGLVLFFTGLSGSGKSTLARALTDMLLEQGARSVTSLDGDVVRRHLSAGLTFSKADRETNIRRIGWVAAEIARHGGVAVVSPIAPFDETRQQVREMVEAAGGAFFLVHVATPLEECERRDRKGLYAKARRGEIPEFTGISSPYEEPEDADVRVDTTGRTVEAALADVLTTLRADGYLDLPVVEQGVRASARASSKPPQPTADPHPGTAPLKILFVCTANICRSPSMELMARRMTAPNALHLSSAGTHGYVDHPVDETVAAALPEGIADPTFRSRRLTKAMLDEADLVLTAESTHRDYVLTEHPGLFRKVYSLGQFAAAVERAPVDADPRDLLAHVSTQRGTADPALDVPDPYRRGPEAAATAVSQIQQLLAVVVPRLAMDRMSVR